MGQSAPPEDTKARRLARLVVSEIRLYHDARLASGDGPAEAQERLTQDVERGREWLHRRLGSDTDRLDQHFRNALLEFFPATDAGLLETAMTPALAPKAPAAAAGIPVDLTQALDEIETYVSLGFVEDARGVLAKFGSRLAAFPPLVQRLAELGFAEERLEEEELEEDCGTQYSLGNAYREMGLVDDAIAAFLRAAKDESRLFECACNLGGCFLEKGLPKKAVEWFEKGLQAPGRSHEEYQGLRHELASALEDAGQPERAFEILSQAESWFSPSEVHALSRLSGLIALVTRRARHEASGLTAEQRGEVLSALGAARECLAHSRVEEFDACIRRLERALRLLEPD